MKFTTEIDTEVDPPRAVGEYLRSRFWDQTEGKYGCYSTFTYCPDVEELPDEPEPSSDPDWYDDIVWHCAQWNGIKCRWYWDGDGMIEFTFPDGRVLRNSDCKKDYEWEWDLCG